MRVVAAALASMHGWLVLHAEHTIVDAWVCGALWCFLAADSCNACRSPCRFCCTPGLCQVVLQAHGVGCVSASAVVVTCLPRGNAAPPCNVEAVTRTLCL